ncbi:hypothetical protein R1sor_012625 [Riccia sorocarpa]|uniref:MULE transposase domain-containing protein n=1 Tax=Riccia sorocarpa TaxID=122646 RepID=A0ABD3I7K6_9MARC
MWDGAVEAVAGRIKGGEVFKCFKEFDFCADCWCMMNMRSSVKLKTKSSMRVRVCRYGLPVRKKGVGKIIEWPGESSSQNTASTDLPHALGVRSYRDFSRRLRNPSQLMLRHDRPNLNLHSQEFSQSIPRRKRNKCPRGECEEHPRYEAVAMVRTAFEDSEDEEGSDAEDEGQECGKGPSKKPPNNKCEWRIRCTLNKRTVLLEDRSVGRMLHKEQEVSDTTIPCNDGNSQIVPLAYALAPMENFENWMWFLHNLRISIQGLSSEEVFIVSDRQKGLEKAVSEMLPENPHMKCGHHLKMNVQKHFGKVAVQVLQSLFHAPSEER